ncbi:unnamed protein product [Tenebrio molitor]|nr:unnamed protein product [Tenebrio molitor]
MYRYWVISWSSKMQNTFSSSFRVVCQKGSKLGKILLHVVSQTGCFWVKSAWCCKY